MQPTRTANRITQCHFLELDDFGQDARSRYIYKDLKVSVLQTNAQLAQKGLNTSLYKDPLTIFFAVKE